MFIVLLVKKKSVCHLPKSKVNYWQKYYQNQIPSVWQFTVENQEIFNATYQCCDCPLVWVLVMGL